MPWSKARAWIDTGKVYIDGNRATDPGRLVVRGERLELRMSAPKAQPASELNREAIVYFDDDIVVVNKPPGLMTVPHPASSEPLTLDRLVTALLRSLDPNTRRTRDTVGVVHRIDKETSGLVVFTRNFPAMQALSEQFRQHSIQRRYLALAHGTMANRIIRSRLVRDAGLGIRGSVAPGRVNKTGEALGREAITRVKLLEKLNGASLVECRLETGRTHQIRIHLSEAGHPILGESVYIRDYKGPIIPAPRVMLHALQLGFLHPSTGERVQWEQPLPKDFVKRLERLRMPTPPGR